MSDGKAKTAVIVGAGPVGALAAIMLAQRGYSVQVFDKRPQPDRRPPPDDRKAYLLNLNARAMRAFEAAGVSVDELCETHNGAVEMVFFRPSGRVQHSVRLPVQAPPRMLRVYRDEIARHLIDAARQLHPGAISFTFSAPLESVDFRRQTATFAGPGKKTSSGVHYDLLVGADGAGSAVRQQLAAALPPGFVTHWSHSIVYATGPLQAPPGELPPHTYMELRPFPGGSAMIYSRGDGDRRVGFFMEKRLADRIQAGDSQWLAAAVDRMASVAQGARNALKALAAARPEFQKMAGWTYLTQLHGPQTVLLGDAAHTMTPFLGQGCNSGLEDVRVFAQTLDRVGGDVTAALPAFSAERLPEVRALVELNEIAAQERAFVQGTTAAAHRLWVSGHSTLLSLSNVLRGILSSAAPWLFSRPPLQRAQQGELRFRDVRPALYWDLAAVAAVAVAGAAAIARFVPLRRQA